jgi:hypothetical protein
MTSLHELQRDMTAALLGRGAGGVVAAMVTEDGIAAEARLLIYRHHVVTTLTAALRATFPVVCRLVDERFFGYAADEYIRQEPPAGPCLFEYGETFPEFLEAFPACAPLPYLADVARLEWALNRALHATDRVPLVPAALQAVTPADAGNLVFALDASVSLLSSPWPIDAIWRANQPASPADGEVDLRAGGATLEIRRFHDDAIFRPLGAAGHAFRRALAEGSSLAVATERAMAVDAEFDLPGAMAGLFEDGLLIDFTCPSSTGEPAIGGDHRRESQR